MNYNHSAGLAIKKRFGGENHPFSHWNFPEKLYILADATDAAEKILENSTGRELAKEDSAPWSINLLLYHKNLGDAPAGAYGENNLPEAAGFPNFRLSLRKVDAVIRIPDPKDVKFDVQGDAEHVFVVFFLT